MSENGKLLEPCPGCPWRKSVKPGGTEIPGFSLAKMRGLRNTVGKGDALRSIMACHHSKPGAEFACRGYVAVEGWTNINVRILASKGELPVREIEQACKGIELWPSFGEMLEAYEEANR
jgi:hypothetical protein